jgi:outer membrane protein OmpA-like peptidoglycan-associated protein
VNKFQLKSIALAVGLAFSASSMAAEMSAADHSASQGKIVADFNAAKLACATMSGNRLDICMVEAQVGQQVATAKLQASYQPSAEASYQVGLAQAAADAAIAKERCDDSTGSAKTACLQAAQTAETAARAKADRELKSAQDLVKTPAIPAVATEAGIQAADTLFDFDSSALRPAGRATLDDFIAKTNGSKSEQVQVVGYTDRFGTRAYNQRLSEARVKAVEAYLIAGGIDADRIQAEGKGQAQPVTNAGDCQGERSASVIECLQPDRRVVVGMLSTVAKR